MKTVRRYFESTQAGLMKSRLEAEGIDAVLADDAAFSMGPQYVPKGIRLQVAEGDEARALELLAEMEQVDPLPEGFDPAALSPEPPEAGATGEPAWRPAAQVSTWVLLLLAIALLVGVTVMVRSLYAHRRDAARKELLHAR